MFWSFVWIFGKNVCSQKRAWNKKIGSSLMFILKKLAHLALWIFVQFAVVILQKEQSTSIEIYGFHYLFVL